MCGGLLRESARSVARDWRRVTDHLFELAMTVGREASAFVAQARPSGRVGVAATKSSPTDVVTEIDRGCEQLIRDRILAVRPDDGFLGEEHAEVLGTSRTQWIVDPIDGTVNFVYGLPCYAVSIGVAVDGVVETGYITNIATGAEYGGIRGRGSFRMDAEPPTRLAAGPPQPLAHALVATGFNYVREVRIRQAAAVAAMLPHIRDIRRTGSAALDLCALAAGEFDGYVEQGLMRWDLAAGRLIAEEAGIVFSGLNGEPDERLVMAAPPALAPELFALVKRCHF